MKAQLFLVGILFVGLLVAGCTSGDREVSPPATAQNAVEHDHDGDGKPDHDSHDEPAGAPTGGGMEDLKQPDKVVPVAEAKAAYEKAKKASTAAPTDEKAKKDYLAATIVYADANMFGDLPSNVKYKEALKYYREALELDPKNAHATAAKTTIEEIYKSMGRPVPGEGG